MSRPGLLAGVRVVDLSMGWAGPLAARHLADMGADVVKVEGCVRFDWWRGWEATQQWIDEGGAEKSPAFNTVNRNKRGITLDLATSAGSDLLKRLVAISDVVVENYSAGVLPKLGLSFEVLREANPAIVMISMPAFGNDGPWRDFRAYGSTVEQASGLPHLSGSPADPPTMVHVALGDAVGGLNGAAALLAALREKTRTGRGQHLDLSQSQCLFPLGIKGILAQSATGQAPPRARQPLRAPRAPRRFSLRWRRRMDRRSSAQRGAVAGAGGLRSESRRRAPARIRRRGRPAGAGRRTRTRLGRVHCRARGRTVDGGAAGARRAGWPCGKRSRARRRSPPLRARLLEDDAPRPRGELPHPAAPYRLGERPFDIDNAAPTLGSTTAKCCPNCLASATPRSTHCSPGRDRRQAAAWAMTIEKRSGDPRSDAAPPLSGVRVIDATRHWGELAGRTLAELGADVWRFDAAPGDSAQAIDMGDAYAACMRAGKKTLAGADVEAHLENADVFLESGYSGDYSATFPHLIHVSITPFGIAGPMARAPATDLTVEAAGGLAGLQGDADRAPTPMGAMPQAALHAGAQAAADAMIALYERERSGRGQHLDVSAQACVVWTLMNATGYPPNTGANPPATSEFRGQPHPAAAAERLRLPGIVQCKDGLAQVRFQMRIIGERTFDALLRWVEASNTAVPSHVRGLKLSRWMSDLRAGDLDLDAAQQAADLIVDLLATKTKQELQAYAAEHGLTLAAIHAVPDLLEDPHLAARDFWIRTAPTLSPAPSRACRARRCPDAGTRRLPHLSRPCRQVMPGSGEGARRRLRPSPASKSPTSAGWASGR